MHYLMAVSGVSSDCTGGGDSAATCTQKSFLTLPGVNQLNDRNWGGVLRDDFITG